MFLAQAPIFWGFFFRYLNYFPSCFTLIGALTIGFMKSPCSFSFIHFTIHCCGASYHMEKPCQFLQRIDHRIRFRSTDIEAVIVSVGNADYPETRSPRRLDIRHGVAHQ